LRPAFPWCRDSSETAGSARPQPTPHVESSPAKVTTLRPDRPYCDRFARDHDHRARPRARRPTYGSPGLVARTSRRRGCADRRLRRGEGRKDSTRRAPRRAGDDVHRRHHRGLHAGGARPAQGVGGRSGPHLHALGRHRAQSGVIEPAGV
jgi:hypothetical protein